MTCGSGLWSSIELTGPALPTYTPKVLHLTAVNCDAVDPARLSAFWAALLGRDVVEETAGPLLPGSAGQVALRFVPSQIDKGGQNRTHMHLTSVDVDHQRQTVATALELGGRHVDVGQRPDDGHVVLGDPEGNEFCVIEPGNAFLAGCGFLGEVAGDGTRHVGLFWSKALGWPLVWDQDEETAIQSPHGGTKIAWGGPPLADGPDRHRFELATSDRGEEINRLLDLGATLLRTHGDVVAMGDPDGNPFRVTSS